MAASVIKKMKLSGNSGSFTPESGVTISELRIRQTGDVIEVHFYATLSTALSTSQVTLGTVSGVSLPPANIRTMAGGGAAAYNADKPIYAAITSAGKVNVTNVSGHSGITVVVFDIVYTVD